VLGIVAIGLGILANGQNIASWSPAFACAAAANLPRSCTPLYWRRSTQPAARCGACTAPDLDDRAIVSPPRCRVPRRELRSLDCRLFPLANPGIVSIRWPFILGILRTLSFLPMTRIQINRRRDGARSLTASARRSGSRTDAGKPELFDNARKPSTLGERRLNAKLVRVQAAVAAAAMTSDALTAVRYCFRLAPTYSPLRT